jgi:hypothetical protein
MYMKIESWMFWPKKKKPYYPPKFNLLHNLPHQIWGIRDEQWNWIYLLKEKKLLFKMNWHIFLYIILEKKSIEDLK